MIVAVSARCERRHAPPAPRVPLACPRPSRAPRAPPRRAHAAFPPASPGAGSPPRAPPYCTRRLARPRSTAPGWLAHAAPSGRLSPAPLVHSSPPAGSSNRHWLYRRQCSAGRPGPARAGQGMSCAAARSAVDNFTRDVDGETAGSFFCTQAVDGVSAGSKGRGCQSLCRVPIRILSLHTAQSACLHRVSTGLCTPGLDAVGRSAQDCPSHLLQLSWLRVRATGVGWSAGGGGGR
jgi:hypothetical protein